MRQGQVFLPCSKVPCRQRRNWQKPPAGHGALEKATLHGELAAHEHFQTLRAGIHRQIAEDSSRLPIQPPLPKHGSCIEPPPCTQEGAIRRRLKAPSSEL